MAYASSTPDFSGLFDAFQQGADARRRSYLQDLEQRGRELQGAALSGDQNALVELGKISPQAYMQTQQFTQEQKKARLGEFLSAAYNAKTPEAWKSVVDRFRAQGHQFDPGEDDFANRENLIRQGMSVADQMGLDFRTQESQRAQANADRSYALDKERVDLERQRVAEGGANKPPAGYRYKADGSMEFIPGGPADPSKPVPTRAMRPTNDQSNAAGFFDRMSASNKIISGLEKQGTDYWQNFARNYAPAGTAAYLMTPEFQQYDQAQRDFINAQLRKESGAAISESEFENARRQYFPQPGDSDAVIKQKAQNREIAIKAMHRAGAVALEPQRTTQPVQEGELQPGTIEDGYVFLGGDPADQNNWQEAR